MKLSKQLARARARKGLPATLLSKRIGFDQSGIYAIENGRRDARESTLEAIAASLGAQILVVDTDNRGTVAQAAEEIRGLLSNDQQHAAAQVLVQVVSDLRALEALPRLAISDEPPVPIDSNWDAALAGVVEWELSRDGLPAPEWVTGINGDESRQWDPWTDGTVASARASHVPEPLRRRGVWVEEAELTSA